MKVDLGYIYLVIAMGIVTYLPRMLPATLLSNRKIPEFFIKFLRFVPSAVLSALFFPGVLMAENKLNITFSNPLLLASLLTLPIAYKTKNMFATVLSGMGFVILFNYIIWKYFVCGVVSMDMGISSVERQMNTYEKRKLLMVPGECFEIPWFMHIGYGMFMAGLAIFSAYIMRRCGLKKSLWDVLT